MRTANLVCSQDAMRGFGGIVLVVSGGTEFEESG